LNIAEYCSVHNISPSKALGYCFNQWPKLIRYVEGRELNIDNNRAERANKPFVISQKNWQFLNTETGAHTSSILYSIVETAKNNKLVPFDYLLHVILALITRDADSDMNNLLPWNVVYKLADIAKCVCNETLTVFRLVQRYRFYLRTNIEHI